MLSLIEDGAVDDSVVVQLRKLPSAPVSGLHYQNQLNGELNEINFYHDM